MLKLQILGSQWSPLTPSDLEYAHLHYIQGFESVHG